MMAIMLQI